MWKHLKPLLPSIIVALLVAGAANSSVWEWSKTAANNATADSTINWSEGMAPSAVNDSARAMMARLAEYRDDISGSITTSGTSTAFTATTNQGLNATPTTGQLLAVTMHATNGASPTLAADGGTAWPIQIDASNAVPASALVAGTPYTMKFNGSAWVVRNYYGNPFNVPLGTVLDYVGATAPNSNFALAYGQCVSRTTYSALFSLISTTYGTCDGSTTFGLPDYRGRVLAGKDDMGGSAASRLTVTYFGTAATVLGATGGSESHTLSIAEMPAHDHGGATGSGGATTIAYGDTNGSLNTGSGHLLQAPGPITTANDHTHTISSQGGGSAHAIVQPTVIVNKILRIF